MMPAVRVLLMTFLFSHRCGNAITYSPKWLSMAQGICRQKPENESAFGSRNGVADIPTIGINAGYSAFCVRQMMISRQWNRATE